MNVERRGLSAVMKVSFLPRYIQAGVVLCAGVGLSITASFLAWNWEQERLSVQLQKRADNLAAAMQKSINSDLETIQTVGDFYAASFVMVEQKEFKLFAGSTLSRHPSIKTLAWLPRVSNADRQAYEAETALGYPNFQIVEGEPQGTTSRAAPREEYFPATYIEPMARNMAGFDFGSDATLRSALEKARDTGTLAATGRLLLTGDRPSLAVALPIYPNSRPHNTPQTRRQNLKGFVTGIFNLAKFVRASSEGLDWENLNFLLSDETAGAEDNFLAFYDSKTQRAIVEPDSEEIQNRAQFSCPKPAACRRRLNVANRTWSLQLTLAPEYRGAQKHPLAWTAFTGGLILSGLVTAYLLKYQRHTSRVEQLVRELSSANVEIRLLSRLSDLLQACVTLEEAYRVIPRLMQKLFPDYSGAIYRISASGNMVETVTAWGEPLTSQPVFAPNDCWALRCGREHLFENTRSGLACQHYQQPLPEQSLCVPMMAQGETLGLLYLSSPEPGKLTEAKQHLATTVSEHIALALANLKLRETLKSQSIRDPLTSLFNRRYMEEFLERELHRAARAGQPLGIIMIDIDHFKHFNDSFGHDGGDTLLQELAMFLQGSIRGSDIACRYGGEEFTLILPEASLELSQQRAEQLRIGVKHLNVQHRRQPLGPVTLSLGVASFPKHGLTRDEVLQAADAALYRAKKSGRDRAVTASPSEG
jgi:diguanylate cyclase (GGDEF)-like protein